MQQQAFAAHYLTGERGMKLSSTIIVSCLTTLLLLSPVSQAGVSVLDFDSFENGQIIDDEYLASYGVSIDSLNYRDGGIEGRQVAFDTLNNNSRDNDLEYNNANNDYNDSNSAFSYAALNLENYQGSSNPGNVLILQENSIGCGDGVCNYPDDEGRRAAGYFEFSFSSLVSILNIDFFDVEDSANQDAKFYAIHFFDQDDNEIQNNYFVPSMNDGQFVRMAFSGVDNVKRLVLNMPGSGAIDNLAFRVTEVPEPTTFAILGIALAFSLRKKIAAKIKPISE
tara:strand:+ start:35 stop:877 length:843 start_codon:yes stop_codon:yes gene_type:complete